MTKRRHYSSEFKLEAASLIVDQSYTYKEACEAMGVGSTALRRWVGQLKAERSGITPTTSLTQRVYGKLDRIIFWKLAHWLARKYRTSIKSLMR